jgi:hypothetical protein
MRVNEVKKIIEKVVRVEYIAEDGQVFYNEEECKKYEESALFAVSKQLKRLNEEYLSVYDLLDDGSEECEVEVFDVQTDKDLENLRRYLYLKAKKNGANEKYINECFTDEKRSEFVFDGVTKGHEVIIWWNYDSDHFLVYRDGSISGYLSYLHGKIKKLITPEKKEEN